MTAYEVALNVISKYDPYPKFLKRLFWRNCSSDYRIPRFNNLNIVAVVDGATAHGNYCCENQGEAG